MPSPSSEVTPRLRLPRVLSAWDCAANIVCVIIGAGIFVSARSVLELAGSPVAALLAWLLAGIFSLVEAFCFAELALTFPRAGSCYVYLVEGFGEIAGFLYFWIMFFFVQPAVVGISALIFATYFCHLFWFDCQPPDGLLQLLASLAIVSLTAMQFYSTKWAVSVADFFTAVKLLGLLVIILTGLGWICAGHTATLRINMQKVSVVDPATFVMAFYSAYYAYCGISMAVNMVEELREPLKRNIPLSILLAIGTIIAVYLLANVAYFSVLDAEEMVTSHAVAMTFGDRVVEGLSWFISFIVSTSCLGNMSAMIMVTSRLGLASARRSHLPKAFSLISARFRSPIPLLVFNSGLSVLYLCTNTVFELIAYTSYVAVLATSLSVLALVLMRFRRPELHRPIKLPLIVPVAAMLCFAVLLAFPFYSSLVPTLVCFAFLLSGVPVYYYLVRSERIPEFIQTMHVEMTRCVQKLIHAFPEDLAED